MKKSEGIFGGLYEENNAEILDRNMGEIISHKTYLTTSLEKSPNLRNIFVKANEGIPKRMLSLLCGGIPAGISQGERQLFTSRFEEELLNHPAKYDNTRTSFRGAHTRGVSNGDGGG